MNGPPTTSRYSFDRPAVYQIRLQGRLPSAWSDSVIGMAIDVSGDMTGDMTTGADRVPITVLRGELADQAALCGLLNQLYDLQLTILSVMRIEDAHDS